MARITQRSSTILFLVCRAAVLNDALCLQESACAKETALCAAVCCKQALASCAAIYFCTFDCSTVLKPCASMKMSPPATM